MSTQPPQMRLTNDAAPAGERSRLWNWSVWVEASAATLDQIDSVRYTLHPTFSEPVQTVRDRSGSFRLRASGWGEFRIAALVRMKDGQTHELSHWLNLSAGGASSAAHAPSPAPSKSPSPAASEGSEGARTFSFMERALHKAAEGRNTARRAINAVAGNLVPDAMNAVDVFLSYAISDRAMARELTEKLRSMGITIVRADTDLPPGAPVEEWVRRAIASCDAVVALLGTLRSEQVVEEATLAAELQTPLLVAVSPDADVSLLPSALQQGQVVINHSSSADAETLAVAIVKFVETYVRGRSA